jgi:hypothetical protein
MISSRPVLGYDARCVVLSHETNLLAWVAR